MNYSVLAGGKRLRPMLMRGDLPPVWRKIRGDPNRFMAAIEMPIHTYSLVHDDLPAMDNDEYRRGKKTTHAVYGEAMGILAGDALLNYAYGDCGTGICHGTGQSRGMSGISDSDRKGGNLWNGRRSDGGRRVGGKAGHDQGKARFYLPSEDECSDRGAMLIERCWREPRRANRRLSSRQPVRSDLHFRFRDDILDVTSTMEGGRSPSAAMKNHKITYVTYEGIRRRADVALLSSRRLRGWIHMVKNDI